MILQYVHLTPTEARQRLGKEIGVQATIKRPNLYILGQSRSTVEDQMQFVPNRQEDLRDLRTLVSTDSGVEINDTIRFHEW